MVRLLFRIFAIHLLICLVACSGGYENNSDIITVDLLETIDNPKTLKLSELVDNVEYVKLETTPDCNFGLARYLITDNYIIVYEQYNPKILIFDRKGNFIRKFGKAGKGPGELTLIYNIIAFPAEDYLFVHDLSYRKVIKYSFEGEFMGEKTFRSPDNYSLAGISMVGPDRFAVLFTRPVTEQTDYPLIHIYDKNFDLLEELYRVNTKNFPGFYSSQRHSFYVSNGDIHFREYFFDTLSVYDGEKFVPKYHFYIKENRPASYAQDRSSSPRFNEVWEQYEISNYLVCCMDMPGEEEDELIAKWIFFNKRDNTMFTLAELPWYFRESALEPAIYNDIDGIFHIYMHSYTNHLKTHFTEDLIYKATDIIDLKSYVADNHYSEHDVVFPEKQKELIELIERSSENDNPVMQIFHLK